MTVPDPKANETLSEEFRRLISEYHDAADGDPTKEEAAWNLIADFSVANCEAIFDGLSALSAEVASAERIAELERQLAEEQHRHMITEKDACAQAEMRSESERRREAKAMTAPDPKALAEIEERQCVILPAKITPAYVLQKHDDTAWLLRDRQRLLDENEALAIADQKILRKAQSRWEGAEAALKIQTDALSAEAAANAMLREALEYGIGCAKNELVARGLPLEWATNSGIGRMERALAALTPSAAPGETERK
jgi:hypothetical protein